MPEGNDHYIVAGPDIGALQPVGTLKPNPLGLYDILGEVDQIMLDPYRLNRVGRLHGQVGGVLLRGENYLSGQSR
ncbi:SUMF1/EgtB/PvdO family nonheme iron enzyme [Komagataeibacter swingsii]|uniref:SUMF1/EgtB/PvdO family nonheme iron enzyme n=1 Tax=Komagataeibacter swingsii TaxID=215220 RepID=A0A850P6Y4_9PROT|nr:SUMF1/EgtB/PvdO family nonheme iron enzyme [Komagataeibacter swingsii]NVN38350.1 SUMF1/EgtB/PvdO family nonheme iron enzyme [Komagataeibacter swingsii]